MDTPPEKATQTWAVGPGIFWWGESVAMAKRLINGKYRIGEVISESRYATVFAAEHTGIARSVAVSVLREELSAEGPDAARLAQEARAAGSVAHRNVQSVVDSGVDEDGRPFIVYESVEGDSLVELLRDYPNGLPQGRAIILMLQLLEGLSAVHDGGVVHRGVGPDNVRVRKVRGGTELLTLTGFDEAVFVGAGNIQESPDQRPPEHLPPRPYVAPEMGRAGTSSPALDVYGAGVILRALLTGQAESGTAVSDTAQRIIAQATAARPDERFLDAHGFAGAVSLLRPTSLMPPRDGMSLPEDPLVADLHYMRLRRMTGHIDRTTKMGEAAVNLMPFLIVVEAIYQRLGRQGWARLVQRVPEVDDLLPGSGNTQINRERGISISLVSRVLEAVDAMEGTGDLVTVVDLGQRVAHKGLHRFDSSLPERIPAAQFAPHFGQIWAELSRQGEVELRDASEGRVNIVLRHQAEASLEFCALVSGIMREALGVGGAQNTSVRKRTCQSVGDPLCLFELSF